MSTQTGHEAHFVRLARTKHPGASSGEKAARRLALALCRDLPSLDERAFDGLLEFALLIRSAPTTARDLIDGWE